ncbi:MAG TPA: hypothetical protein VK953_01670 [Methylophilus sp.]|nr:hypothetical protein [Methylophilus sp.]
MAQQQIVVLVGHDQWRVVHFKRWRYQALHAFTANAENQALLMDRLKQSVGANVYFLTDIADEHYHVEVLPPVRGAARKQLLARRLAAWPFAQGLHAVHKAGEAQGVRQEGRYLFSAIHYPPLREWLQVLQKETLCVQGVYTQTLCIPCWASHLQSGHAQCLIAWFEKRQLRIRYLYRSQLLFSRQLTLTSDEFPEAHINTEIAQTRLYLENQKWLQKDEPLHLLWLTEDPHSNGLSSEQLPTSTQLSNMSYAEVMCKSGWNSLPAALNVMDWAAIQLVRHSPRLPNFAPETTLLNGRVAKAKRNIAVAGVIMVCLFVMANRTSEQALQKTQSDIQRTNARLHLWQSAKPDWAIEEADLPRLQTFSRAVQNLEVSARFPDRAWNMLQGVMTGEPGWQLKEVDWRYGAINEAKHTQPSLPDNPWVETAKIRFARKTSINASEARQAWQLLLEKLRQHPDVVEVKEVNISANSGSPVQTGDTRHSLLPDVEPTLTIRLRGPKGAT